ncbi:MAG TPA: hypothetical protein VLF61_01035 [Rhabdochlamydiaceae bacterium]|nr:hypothetical protein [Rhabdochlamydiaceae bacterium]
MSIVSIYGLLISAPTIASSSWGRKTVLFFLNKKFSGKKIQAQEFSLSWFGKQKIRGVQWTAQKEGLFFRCEEISSSIPLWKLLLNHQLGELKLTAPHIELDADLSPSLKPAFSASPAPPVFECGFLPQLSLNKNYFGTISIDHGSLLIFSKNKPLASFQKVVSHIHLPEDQFPIQCALIGQTEQGQLTGKFDIKAEISSLNFDQPHLEVQAKLLHFPIFGMDELLSFFDPSFKGLLVETIGPSFDLDLEAKFAPQSQELYLMAQSALVQAEIQAESVDGRLTLKSPAKLNFSISPDLFQRYEALRGFSLTNSPEVTIEMEKLSLPYGLDFKKAHFQSQVKVAPAYLIANETNETISLDALSFSLSSNQLEKDLKFISNGSLKMGHLNSQIQLKADLQEPFSNTIQGNCKIQLQEFPIKIAEQLLSEKLVTLFGPSFDGLCTLNISKEATHLNFKATTPLLKISEIQLRIDDKVTLLQPILADYHSSPRLSPIQLSINECVFPRHSWEQLAFNCHFQIPTIHDWLVDQLEGQIQVNTLDNIRMKVAGQEIDLDCLLGFNNALDELKLKEPLSLNYLLTPTKFQSLFPQDTKNPILLAPAALHLSVAPFVTPVALSTLQNLKASATASIDTLSLQYEEQVHTLKNVHCQLSIDALNETLDIYFKSEGQPIELKATVKSYKLERPLDFSKSQVYFSMSTEEFPLGLLDGLVGSDQPLTTLFGPSLNLNFQAETSPEEQLFSLAAKGKSLNFETSFGLKNRLLTVKKPTTFDWILNEKSYALLDRWLTEEKEAPFELQKPAHFHLSIPTFSYLLTEQDLNSALLNATLISDHCNFIEKKTGRIISLDQFKLALSHLNQTTPIALDLGATVNREGKCVLKAEFDPRYNQIPFSAQIQGQIQKLPTVLLDICARPLGRTDFPFSIFFGETLNAQVAASLKNFTGPVQFNIHSPNVRTSLDGSFENGILTLNQPLHAQILLTHKISSLFLKEVNPLSITSIESLHPVTLQIDSEGFSLPFTSEWQTLSIPNAHIELGQIFCKNEGNLSLTLGLLKQNIEPSSDLSLWFTPIDLHIQDHTCTLERTEILINNSLEICTFGNIDLAKEHADMVLGLTSQCLHKAFGIENLPPDYVLQVPLKGSMDRVKLDTKKATAKITALLLWQKSGLASSVIGKGSTGALIGELIGKLATLPDRDTQSPTPKQPYPWDKNKTAKAKQPKLKKKTKIKKNEKPLKQLLKILT